MVNGSLRVAETALSGWEVTQDRACMGCSMNGAMQSPMMVPTD